MAEVVTPFHGDKEEESPEDFLREFYRRMGDKSDEVKKKQFPYYLQAYSVADEWFSDLVADDKKTWADIEAAFHKRWPKKKQIKKTDEEYEDEILGKKLKEEHQWRPRKHQIHNKHSTPPPNYGQTTIHRSQTTSTRRTENGDPRSHGQASTPP